MSVICKNQELGDLVENPDSFETSRKFYDSLTPQEKSLINICVDDYDGNYREMMKRLRGEYRKNRHSSVVRSLADDIKSLKKIYDHVKKYCVNLYMIGILN